MKKTNSKTLNRIFTYSMCALCWLAVVYTFMIAFTALVSHII